MSDGEIENDWKSRSYMYGGGVGEGVVMVWAINQEEDLLKKTTTLIP